MNTHKTASRLGRRAIAVAGALALGFMGVAAAMPASAAEVGNVPPAPDGGYTLNIHKYEQPNPAWDLDNDGTEQTVPSDAKPLDGVEFTVAHVNNIDLTTAAGWQATKGLTPADVADHLDAGTVLTTKDGGLATGKFPLGVYLVTETKAPANAVGTTAPFLVTLPFPNHDAWLTTLNVYPKNMVQGQPTKSVDDSTALGLGSTVSWTIDTTVPAVSQGNSITTFVVTDDLDSRLTPTGVTVALTDAHGTPVELSDENYTVTTGDPLKVTFTDKGRGILEKNAGGTVTVTITTTVTSVGDGQIQNTAVTNVNGKDFDSNTVQTNWGSLTLKKVAGTADGNALKGAKFQVYSAVDTSGHVTGDPVSINGKDVFESNADGIVNIAGLRTGENGTGTSTYYIVESEAPVGFDVAAGFAPEKPHAVTVKPGSTANGQIVVVDPQVPAFELPLTGGGGTAIFVGAGVTLVLMAAGAAFLVYSRRRQATHQQ
ncbi:SpaH/EbpB family LPXTG-anchored major pilin [Microbacterium luticocti]|uniref:SpaH/EbpB family LPXTG-anchored major pilin n=1 Tax=Microbacterium luticocti TaxID=451764 RepID=UPI00040704BC|nr:SpaH/EbpB family LPXTG-anchored major pilin [Microbacterium luticocti]